MRLFDRLADDPNILTMDGGFVAYARRSARLVATHDPRGSRRVVRECAQGRINPRVETMSFTVSAASGAAVATRKRSPWRVGFLPTRVSGRRREGPRDAARPRRVARRPRRSSRTRRRQRRRPGCVQQGHAGVFQDALRVPPRVGTVACSPVRLELGPTSRRASAPGLRALSAPSVPDERP